MKKKLLFFSSKKYEIEFFNEFNKNFGFDISYLDIRLDSSTVILANGYDGVCCFVHDELNSKVLDKLKSYNINIVVLRCAGYNNVDLKRAFENKIHILRVPIYSPHAVAEHTVALILALNRKIHKAYIRVKELNFDITGFLGFDLYKKTAGVIGTGNIGKIVAKILKLGFEMEVLAYDPKPDYNFSNSIGIKYTDLNEIFEKSDIITLHCPLTKDTYHILNEQSFEKMKKGVMIINTSRGGLIDTKSLIKYLKNNKIGYAGLDVYEEEEEYFFEDFSTKGISDDTLARLLTFPNVLITSHQAFFTKEALENIALTSLNNFKSFFNGLPLENEICYKCGQERTSCNKQKLGRCF